MNPVRTSLATVLLLLAMGPARHASADTWSIEANLIWPDQSLKAHQPGPGLSVQWERPLSAHWQATLSTGYLTLVSQQVPSYQMLPIQGGARWALRENGHGPYLAADLGLFVTVESFRFRFGDTTVTSDDWGVAWGPGVTMGYQIWRLAGDAGYEHLFGESEAGFFRIRLGYRL